MSARAQKREQKKREAFDRFDEIDDEELERLKKQEEEQKKKELQKSWYQAVFGWLSPAKLPRPPTWDGMERPLKETQVQTIDGFSFELQKNAKNYGAYYGLTLGGSQEPYAYTFGVTLAERDEREEQRQLQLQRAQQKAQEEDEDEDTEKPAEEQKVEVKPEEPEEGTGKDQSVALGRVNFKDYSVNGTFIWGLNPNWTFRFQPMMSPQPHSSGIVLEADYKGDDHTATVKFVQPQYMWEASYTQSVSQFWRVGSQLVYAHKQGVSGLQFMVQRKSSRSTFTTAVNMLLPSISFHVSQEPEFSDLFPPEDNSLGIGFIEVQNPAKIPQPLYSNPTTKPFFKFDFKKFNLFSELMIGRNPQTGVVDINSRYGCKVGFLTGSFHTAVDIHGVITGRYEERFSENASVAVTIEADQRKSAYKAGIGFQFSA